ncbi:IclR family transcriptional regulator [Phaeobacter sp. QD34_3]|uniref:IclR family transcriptional regulator n=1 Tax=unclassified Phaeobacter TaxID=2621772 RepID=UPI00237F12BA|nr:MULTISPECIES: IclR family transcriptional regulator [unclassified Phaeobacter]MDE4132834.1 IclR family transcriptional regulator [Phaeobacter sp. QD34_3]MDE4136373.1 IclR family transcriptional regulator [Phaeobacter sp. QD34_24]
MGTVTKALSLLGYFSHGRPEIGLSDLTRLSGMNKATVYRLMSELQESGFVEQADGDRSYRLGPQVLRLAALREAAVPILSVSRRVLKDLSTQTGETTHLSLVQGSQLNSLSHAYSPRHATRVMMEDAEVLTYHGTASGLAVLAFAEPDFVDAILSGPLHSHTAATVTDPEAIRAHLREVRKVGMAQSVGGFEAEVHSHAVPVFGPDAKVIGALAVAAPVSRMTADQAALIPEALRGAGRTLTHRIGGAAPADYPNEAAA